MKVASSIDVPRAREHNNRLPMSSNDFHAEVAELANGLQSKLRILLAKHKECLLKDWQSGIFQNEHVLRIAGGDASQAVEMIPIDTEVLDLPSTDDVETISMHLAQLPGCTHSPGPPEVLPPTVKPPDPNDAPLAWMGDGEEPFSTRHRSSPGGADSSLGPLELLPSLTSSHLLIGTQALASRSSNSTAEIEFGTGSRSGATVKMANTGSLKRSFVGTELEPRSLWTEMPTEAQQEAIWRYEKSVTLEAIGKNSPQRFHAGITVLERALSLRDLRAPSWRRFKHKRTCDVLHPACKVRTCWNLASVFLISTDALTIPLVVFDVGDTTPWHVLNWFATIFWTADVVLNFRTGYFEGAKVELRPRQVSKQYVKTWFAFDIFLVLFEWFSRFYSSLAPPSVVRTTRVFRTIRLVKLLRVAKMKNLAKDFLERIKSNTLILILHVILLTTLLTVLCHFVTCIWYALGDSASDGWTSYDFYATQHLDLGFIYWYVSSARWVVSQLNGRTDMDERRNLQERGFAVFSGMILAVVGRSVFVALITKAMLQLSDLYKKREERRKSVNDYLNLHSVSSIVERSVKAYARQYKDIDVERRREGIVLSLLPKSLQLDLLTEVRKPLLHKHPLFGIIIGQFMSAARHLCLDVIKQIHAESHESVFEATEPCTRMLVLDTGSMTYWEEGDDRHASAGGEAVRRKMDDGRAKDSTHVEVIHGMWLSEAAIWVKWVNRGFLITENYCCMLEVDAMLFGPAIQRHTDLFAFIVVYARFFIRFLAEEPYLSDILSFDVHAFENDL